MDGVVFVVYGDLVLIGLFVRVEEFFDEDLLFFV